LLESLVQNFQNREDLRLMLANKTPRFGNDHDGADALMQRVYESLFKTIDGRSNTKGGVYHLNMLSTTCHVYFGTKLGATPDGRFAGFPESDGTSPSQGADRNGPTAVCQSLGKMDQIKSGGTLLNVRFLPHVLDGHHIQFNVVDSDTLRDAQKNPDLYRDLLVRVAGYSDYFCDLTPGLQEEIISRTAQSSF
jgi:formate C-acetyltransferase